MNRTLRHTLRLMIASILALSLLTPALATAGDKQARAVDTVNRLLNNAQESIEQHGPEHLSGAISPFFAFEIWARFLLKPRKQLFTPKQTRAFRQLLPGYMAHLYHDQFAKGLKGKPIVGQARRVRKDHLVESRFNRKSGKTLPVEWRVRSFRGGNSLIIDIMVGGTSFMLLKRDEFSAKVDQSGPEGLLNYLRRLSQ